MSRKESGFTCKLRHQARNIVIAFFAIVICLSSSSLWLNQRDKVPAQTAANANGGSVEVNAKQDVSDNQDSSYAADSAQDDSVAPAVEQMATVQQDGSLAAESVGVDGAEAPQSAPTPDETPQDSSATSVPESYLKPVESVDAFVTDTRKISGNRLIIGADNLPDDLLSTNHAIGYDAIWFASYDNESDMQSDYKSLKATGYDAVPDMSVQVCDNEHIEYSWLQKLKTMIRRIWGSLIYAEDEKSLSEQMENLDSSNQTVVLLDTGDTHAEAAVNLTKGTLADNNGHGTEMDSIIREKAGRPVNVVSIKTVDSVAAHTPPKAA